MESALNQLYKAISSISLDASKLSACVPPDLSAKLRMDLDSREGSECTHKGDGEDGNTLNCAEEAGGNESEEDASR